MIRTGTEFFIFLWLHLRIKHRENVFFSITFEPQSSRILGNLFLVIFTLELHPNWLVMSRVTPYILYWAVNGINLTIRSCVTVDIGYYFKIWIVLRGFCFLCSIRVFCKICRDEIEEIFFLGDQIYWKFMLLCRELMFSRIFDQNCML